MASTREYGRSRLVAVFSAGMSLHRWRDLECTVTRGFAYRQHNRVDVLNMLMLFRFTSAI